MGRSKRYGMAMVMAGALALAPGAVTADSATHTYDVFSEANVGVAPNGDTVHVTCEAGEGFCGTFSVHPKSIEASGEFEHHDAEGNCWSPAHGAPPGSSATTRTVVGSCSASRCRQTSAVGH